MNRLIIRLLLVGAAVSGFGVTAVDAVDDGGLTQLTAEAPSISEQVANRVEVHSLPACPSNTNVWMDYRADTYTDDGGHTYGPATTLTCNPDGDNTLHIRYIPSAWSLATAHTYCADSGSVGAFTRYSGAANVCPDVDF